MPQKSAVVLFLPMFKEDMSFYLDIPMCPGQQEGIIFQREQDWREKLMIPGQCDPIIQP